MKNKNDKFTWVRVQLMRPVYQKTSVVMKMPGDVPPKQSRWGGNLVTDMIREHLGKLSPQEIKEIENQAYWDNTRQLTDTTWAISHYELMTPHDVMQDIISRGRKDRAKSKPWLKQRRKNRNQEVKTNEVNE